jgi:hypothetical protein
VKRKKGIIIQSEDVEEEMKGRRRNRWRRRLEEGVF